MNVLFTGSNGFVARELIDRLQKNKSDVNILATTRSDLNVLDSERVDSFFKNNKVDVVVHCAVSGGRRNKGETSETFYDNIRMFENLAKHSDSFKFMISFGSGAERDRTCSIWECEEDAFTTFNDSLPKDFYGFSKYVIANRILSMDNIFNLRIFNVFGPTESDDRMILGNIRRNIKAEPMIIHQDRWMDFFSVDDLYKVVDYLLSTKLSEITWRDMNMCYPEKNTLKNIAEKIMKATGVISEIVVNKGHFSPSYCGDGTKLRLLDLQLCGLEKFLD